LDKIQNEGIAKADAEAARILEEARKKAAGIVAEAEKKQAAARAQSEVDAKLFQQRAEQAVRQAARDVVLGVSEAVDQTLRRVLLAKTTAALSPEFLQTFVADVVRAYAASAEGGQGIEILASPEQADKLSDYLLKSIQDSAAVGLKVRPDRDVTAGFRVSLAGGRIEHDFSAQAIQAAMARLLRPALAKLLASD
jgi:V/A-type H+-transporting ATPase subunit E